MRVLLDTNIFVYMSTDPEYLSRDVLSLLKEPDTLLYISAESVRELIVGYRNKGLCSKRWKTVEAMVAAIENEFYVQILPVNLHPNSPCEEGTYGDLRTHGNQRGART